MAKVICKGCNHVVTDGELRRNRCDVCGHRFEDDDAEERDEASDLLDPTGTRRTTFLNGWPKFKNAVIRRLTKRNHDKKKSR